MVEVRDENSGAILFKKTAREKKMDEMIKELRDLSKRLAILEELAPKEVSQARTDTPIRTDEQPQPSV